MVLTQVFDDPGVQEVNAVVVDPDPLGLGFVVRVLLVEPLHPASDHHRGGVVSPARDGQYENTVLGSAARR